MILDLIVTNPDGIHARPSALIAESLEEIDVTVTFQKIGTKEIVDAKSILSLLQLAASQNSIIHIVIKGSITDEEKAASALKYLFSSNFKDAY